MRSVAILVAILAACSEHNPESVTGNSGASRAPVMDDSPPACGDPDITTACSNGSPPDIWGTGDPTTGFTCPDAEVIVYDYGPFARQVEWWSGDIHAHCDLDGQWWVADAARRCFIYCRNWAGDECMAIHAPEGLRACAD